MADRDDLADQVGDDDWATAMQAQATAEADAEAREVAAELAAIGDDSPYQAQPASHLFPDFGATTDKVGGLNDFDMILDIPVQITV